MLYHTSKLKALFLSVAVSLKTHGFGCVYFKHLASLHALLLVMLFNYLILDEILIFDLFY